MKLLFAVVQNDDYKTLTRSLVEHNISVTRIASTGGFLRGGNSTLMIGVDNAKLEETLNTIRDCSSRRHIVTVPATGIPHNIDSVATPMTVTVGGAIVFILEVEDFVKF